MKFDAKGLSYVAIAIILAIVAFKFIDYLEGKERRDRINELDYQNEQLEKDINFMKSLIE